MDIIRGCECFGRNCNIHPGPNDAPCAFLIKRDGKEIKVCTKCDISLRGDEYIARLFDEDSDATIFLKYDSLGFFCILDLVDDNEWKEFLSSKITKLNN